MHDSIDFSQMNTVEDIINILSKLSFNADNFEKVYYNMYISEEPMDITFRQYISEGVINELTIPNVAKMKTTSYTSEGDPNGKIEAPKGSICVDVTTKHAYYKREDLGNRGWVDLWSEVTLGKQGSSADNLFIAPDGDANKLTGLNMENIKTDSVPLTVKNGGTGASSLESGKIIKGNGTSPFSVALDGTDYLGASSTIGIIMYYPVIFGEDGNPNIPNNWLVCDGSEYSGATGSIYKNLYDVIGVTYGGSGTTFKVPNLLNNFVRCLDSTDSSTARAATNVQSSQNKTHLHSNAYSIAPDDASHSHGASTNTTGNHCHGAMGEQPPQHTGDFGPYDSNGNHWGSYGDIDGDNTLWNTSTDGNHSHRVTVNSSNMAHTHTVSGSTGTEGESEFNVINMALVPIIKF